MIKTKIRMKTAKYRGEKAITFQYFIHNEKFKMILLHLLALVSLARGVILHGTLVFISYYCLGFLITRPRTSQGTFDPLLCVLVTVASFF